MSTATTTTTARASKLLIALGNHPPQYARTRHNAGVLALNAIAAQTSSTAFARASNYESSTTPSGTVLLRPCLFMNECGLALKKQFTKGYDVCAVHDELELPLGKVRLKKGGSAKGHNGVKSVAQALGSLDFYRLQIGIGRPVSRDPSAVYQYVLSPFKPDELEEVNYSIALAMDLLARRLGCKVVMKMSCAVDLVNNTIFTQFFTRHQAFLILNMS